MKILICDDDKSIVEQIKNLILEFFKNKNTEIDISFYTNSSSVLKDNTKFDIAFVDIEMPQANGLEITRHIKQNNHNVIVFIITAFQHYLDDAMDLNIFRYISKPISKERFFNSLNKAVDFFFQNIHIVIVENTTKRHNLFMQDIIYATIFDKKSIKIITAEQQYISYESWTYWQKTLLNNNRFSKTHYSFIVNLGNVIGYDKNEVTIRINASQTITIPISRRYYKIFKEELSNYIGETV